jgi:hypothetical protein
MNRHSQRTGRRSDLLACFQQSWTFLTNLSEFLKSCRFKSFFILIDVFDVFSNMCTKEIMDKCISLSKKLACLHA